VCEFHLYLFIKFLATKHVCILIRKEIMCGLIMVTLFLLVYKNAVLCYDELG
jgi:hypothetical protein